MKLKNRNFTKIIDYFSYFTLGLGVLYRTYLALGSNFPLNDGGMFYVMTKDLIKNHFLLPAFTTYNFNQIPFVYPPLGFYVMGILNVLGNIDLIILLRMLPFLFSLMTIFVFYLLSREFLASKSERLLSTAFYTLLLATTNNLLMGGGLTRSLGILFFLLSVKYFYKVFLNKYNKHDFLLLILSVSFAILSHPETILVTVISCGIMFLFSKKKGKIYSLLYLVGWSALLTSFWWLNSAIKHGFGVFLRPLNSEFSETSVYPFMGYIYLIFSWIILLPVTVLGFYSVIKKLLKKEFLLPLVFIAIIFLDRRSPDRYAFIFLAILASKEFIEIIKNYINDIKKVSPGTLTVKYFLLRQVKLGLIFWVIISPIYVWFLNISLLTGSIDTKQRAAMKWVSENTPKDSNVLVISQNYKFGWGYDGFSEWFPALAQRRSLTTIQGREWLQMKFSKEYLEYKDLLECHVGGINCFSKWNTIYKENYSYIFVSKKYSLNKDQEKNSKIYSDLLEEGKDKLVYDNNEVAVFEVNSN